jgi:IS1 family transposase
VQLDEKWSFVAKKQKHCGPEETRCGDCWDHVALDAASRLVLSVVAGKRTEAQACQGVHELRERTDGRPLNLITTDAYPAYATALAAVYAEPAPAGASARPVARRLPDGLVYATVHKVRQNNRVVKSTARRVYGTLLSLAAALAGAVLGVVNTVFVERNNGTDRHRNSRKARKTYRFSKDWEVHQAMSFFTLYSANYCWAVRTLREEIAPRRYRPRTAAMAAGLTDHVWPLKEWLLFPATQRYRLPPFQHR